MKPVFILLCLIITSLCFSQSESGSEGRMFINRSIDNCGAPELKVKTSKVGSPITVRFSWPMQQADGFNDPGYWGISGYIDQDPTSGILDYNGGNRTYDGHLGTDLFVFPFEWKKVDEGHVEVIAAAPGVIEAKFDGNAHNHCNWNQGSNWNAVYVKHDDGSLAMYGHMKSGSLLTKLVGESVIRGEVLGVLASSGRSTGPHLHFEIHDDAGNVIDPWFGDENSTITESLWENQVAYHPSGVNYLSIATDKPEVWGDACPDIENTFEQDFYSPGDLVYFSPVLRHVTPDQTTWNYVLKPNGDTFSSWNFSIDSYNNGYWYWASRTLPTDANNGTWKFGVDYEGVTYEREFEVVNSDYDCNGDFLGSAYMDVCGACVAGNTGELPDQCGVTAISSSDITKDYFEVYPNPSIGNFQVLNEKRESYQLDIYSVTGEEVHSFYSSGGTNTYNVESLSSGAYVLKFTSVSRVSTSLLTIE